MFRTKAAAERAALEGEGEEWDTQQCLAFQDEILSSSPPRPSNAVDVASNLDGQIVPEPDSQTQWAASPHNTIQADEISQREPKSAGTEKGSHPEAPTNVELPHIRDAVNGKSNAQVFLRRDSSNRLQKFDSQGNGYLGPGFDKQDQAELSAMTMDDLTQKSTLSLTQENAESAYEQFDIQKVISAQHHSNESPNDDLILATPAANSIHSKHQSVMTDSTAHTYGENDTGHIKLDYSPGPLQELDEYQSQDGSYAVQQVDEDTGSHSYDPQTPAPPVNPFSQKGSVMKGHELFGATQPSSIGRHFASPTSSRPSPDVYNEFNSPQRRMVSSPLVRGPAIEESSPLQSSVRHMLTNGASIDSPHITVPRTPGVQSFDLGPTIQSSSIREPRAYTSMKDSQERRIMAASLNRQDSESDDSESSIEAKPRKRKKDIDEDVQRQLSAVELRRRIPPSSRPRSSSSAVVQVPSTGRRRSIQEDYVAQCEGSDARDTQQEDVIADSQKPSDYEPPESTVLAEIEADPTGPGSGPVSRDETGMFGTSSQAPVQANEPNITPESRPNLDLEQETLSRSHPDPPERESPQPNLPPQEISSDHRTLRTPILSKNQPSDATIPDISRAEDKIRPMGEVADLSNAQEDDGLQDLPGFTQDVEFESAIRMQHSPEPPRISLRTQNNDPPHITSISSSSPAAISPPNKPATPYIAVSAALKVQRPTLGEQEVTSDIAGFALDAIGKPHSIGSGNDNQSVTSQSNFETESVALANDETNGSTPKNIDPESKIEVPGDTKPEAPVLDSLPLAAKRGGLRSKAQLKGPSSALRRTAATSTPTSTPRQSGRVSKSASTTKTSATKSSKSLLNIPSASSTQIPKPQPLDSGLSTMSNKRSLGRRSSPPVASVDAQTPDPALTKRASKRKSGPVAVDYNEATPPPTRSSKRQSMAQSHKESSEDPLTLPHMSSSSVSKQKKGLKGLFNKMAFAVSYVGHEQDRNHATRLILDHGGQILQDGFDCLFEIGPYVRAKATTENETELSLSPMAKSIGFAALIADEHSRKAKYMQALALGLPCLSGQWVSACVSKGTVIDWTPYLLCAGRSSVLGNAYRSRILQPYSAIHANLVETFEARDKVLDGKSILLVIGKGKMDSRKAYIFLTRALGPTRVGQVADLAEARRKLVDADIEGQDWDLLYVDTHEEAAEATVFGPIGFAASDGGSRKRKRGPTPKADGTPAPKRVRVISDEVIVQSLILGQLLEG